MNKAVFFDRDGCLIVDKHYLSDSNQIELFPDTISVLKRLGAEYQLFIVTNQSGVGRGKFTLEQMHQVNLRLLEIIAEQGAHIHGVAFCPHAPEQNCNCRKPFPKLVNDLCSQHQIDPKKSFFIGDKLSDAQCGHNAGMQGCLVFNHHPDFPSFKSLTEFADYVLEQH